MTNLLGFVTASGTTLSSAGSISVPGLKVGDKVIGVWADGGWVAPGNGISNGGSGLEAIITVDDEIQQLSSPLASGTSFALLLLRQ